jgi:hypothetical protein
MPIRASSVWPVVLDHEHERPDRRLPFRRVVLALRQPCDIVSNISQRDQLATARERDWIVEGAMPAFVWHSCYRCAVVRAAGD